MREDAVCVFIMDYVKYMVGLNLHPYTPLVLSGLALNITTYLALLQDVTLVEVLTNPQKMSSTFVQGMNYFRTAFYSLWSEHLSLVTIDGYNELLDNINRELKRLNAEADLVRRINRLK